MITHTHILISQTCLLLAEYAPTVSSWLDHIDVLVILFFIVEFFARLWSSDCVSYYRGWRGKLRFFRNPIRMIDLIVIITSVGVLLSNAKGELIITSLRGVRFIQIFQMVRLDFKFRPWRMMASVVYSQRIHLAIVFYMGFLTLIFVSFLLYFVEKDHNENFESLSATMWWAVVTLTTIGYGDVTPITSTGKLLACVCSLIGVSIFALPAGILGTGLALKVSDIVVGDRFSLISISARPAATGSRTTTTAEDGQTKATGRSSHTVRLAVVRVRARDQTTGAEGEPGKTAQRHGRWRWSRATFGTVETFRVQQE